MTRYVKSGTVNTVQEINSELEKIADAQQDFLSRSGETPTEMRSTFDMNGNRQINLPVPTSLTEPLRLKDLEDFNLITGDINLDSEVKVFSSVADMEIDTNLEVGQVILTEGYKSSSNAGSGVYLVVPAGTGTDNGGTYHDLATHQAKLISSYIEASLFGAMGDGVTDDTDAIQRYIDYAMTDPYEPEIINLSGKHYITSTLIINDGISPVKTRRRNLTIRSGKTASSFFLDSPIVLFSTDEDISGQSQLSGFQCDDIAFICDPDIDAYVMDGAYVRVRMSTCVFAGIKFMATFGINTFSYWFTDCEMQDWKGRFFQLEFESANDILFDNCDVFKGDEFYYSDSQQQETRFVNNTIQRLTGTPIQTRGGRGCIISGNYMEGNCTETGSYYVDLQVNQGTLPTGFAITGNLFFLGGGQDGEDDEFWAINWGNVEAASCIGNYCNGKLNKYPPRLRERNLVCLGNASLDVYELPRNFSVGNSSFSIGPERVTNSDFSSPDGWDLDTGWTIAGGQLIATDINSTSALASQNQMVLDRAYQVTIDVDSLSGDSLNLRIGNGRSLQISSAGTYTYTCEPLGNGLIILSSSSGGSNMNAAISSISIKEVPATVYGRLHVKGNVHAEFPEYADDSAAGSGGLFSGDCYRTATGEVRVKL